jgi:hypothetical protein
MFDFLCGVGVVVVVSAAEHRRNLLARNNLGNPIQDSDPSRWRRGYSEYTGTTARVRGTGYVCCRYIIKAPPFGKAISLGQEAVLILLGIFRL